MKIQTKDLTDLALDWVMAKCDDRTFTIKFANKPCITLWETNAYGVTYSPSTYWSQGGPIIERESISVIPFDDRWEARCASSLTPARFMERRGPTPLIAAMRCYCASKFGDEVDVPDELITNPKGN